MAQGQADAGPPPGLVCYNFRCTAFQALILRDQLPGLEGLIERYEAAAARIRNRLADVPGVRVQARGREASPQGYYGLVLIFDDGPLAAVPESRLREAMAAEGLPAHGTYGPVYRHMLYNMDASLYRIDGGATCPVAEAAGTRHAVCLPHPWLGADAKTLDAIATIVAKVAGNAEALRGQDATAPGR
jgi:dTDP-4-amino-4,6-dideoxygalactose transaminase